MCSNCALLSAGLWGLLHTSGKCPGVSSQQGHPFHPLSSSRAEPVTMYMAPYRLSLLPSCSYLCPPHGTRTEV